jgi:hypothetical protein
MDRYIGTELFFRYRNLLCSGCGKEIGRFDHLKGLYPPLHALKFSNVSRASNFLPFFGICRILRLSGIEGMVGVEDVLIFAYSSWVSDAH